jgi:Resolvase, N terminal domain
MLSILNRKSVSQNLILLRYLLQEARLPRLWSSAMKIGYARVSTEDQQLSLQMESLKKAGCKRIFREKVSGAGRKRPELVRLLDQLREGDTVVVSKLDRLARSTRGLLEIVESIRTAGARFQSLGEPWADTTSHAGKMIMTVFAGIAEFERDLIRERTGAGGRRQNYEACASAARKKSMPSRRNWFRACLRRENQLKLSPRRSRSIPLRFTDSRSRRPSPC